jgi:hypothetical protein
MPNTAVFFPAMFLLLLLVVIFVVVICESLDFKVIAAA